MEPSSSKVTLTQRTQHRLLVDDVGQTYLVRKKVGLYCTTVWIIFRYCSLEVVFTFVILEVRSTEMRYVDEVRSQPRSVFNNR